MKKIDIDNSNTFVYDESIEDIKDVIEQHLGKYGYFSDDIDFNDYKEGALIRVDVRVGDCFNYCCNCGDDSNYYRYFIPKDKCVFVEKEEKKLRPFKDVAEFNNKTGCKAIGDVIHIRTKTYNIEYFLAYVGYKIKEDGSQVVYLGIMCCPFDNLLNDYEYYSNGKWLPLGVEE